MKKKYLSLTTALLIAVGVGVHPIIVNAEDKFEHECSCNFSFGS